MESTGVLRGEQALPGHADIATTQNYTRQDFQRLAKLYEGSRPRLTRKS